MCNGFVSLLDCIIYNPPIFKLYLLKTTKQWNISTKQLGRGVLIYIRGPNLITFYFSWGLHRSNTADKGLIELPSGKEYCIFTKHKLQAIIYHHHLPSPLTTMLHPKCHWTFYFHKTHSTLLKMLYPHFRTISAVTVCLFWSEKSLILPLRW